VGAAVPENIAGRDVGETGEQARVGLAAQRWSEFLPQLRGDILKSSSAVLGISQTRSKIGGMGHGPQFEPQGGQAWKFYTDLRIEIRRFSQEKAKLVNMLSNRTEERIVGSIVKAKIVKCKLSDAQGREENFYIRQGEGIDDIRATIEIAVNHNIIRKQGAWFNYGEMKWQGMEQVRKHFKSNRPDLADLIIKIKPHLSKKTDEGPEADVDDDGLGDALDEFIKEVDATENE
jgi:recombination protein RecA